MDGIEWRNEAETSAGEIKFDDVLWKRIFSETSQFLKDSHFSKEDINVNSNTGTQMFVEGKSAMFHGQPTDMQYLRMGTYTQKNYLKSVKNKEYELVPHPSEKG